MPYKWVLFLVFLVVVFFFKEKKRKSHYKLGVQKKKINRNKDIVVCGGNPV